VIFLECWKAQGCWERHVDRSEFETKFWSANRVNFDPEQMPQNNEAEFHGTVAVIEAVETVGLPPGTKFVGDWELAGVVDAFQFGVRFPEVVRQHKQVLALGSLGPITGPKCDVRRFCSSLFVFSEDEQASVSLGIERLEKAGNGLLVPKGTRVLVIGNGLWL